MQMVYREVLTLATILTITVGTCAAAEDAGEYDVVVYGGTSGGVIAAVQAKAMGHSTIIVCPDKHLGGLSSGGLGFTDTGNKAVIGGLAREFYHRIWQKYQQPENWNWQKREEYGNKGQGTPAIDGEQRTMWIFEPHIAEAVFEDLVAEHKIPVHRDQWLDRKAGVAKEAGRIRAITTLGGRSYRGKMFIDATYEGDLMAAAGVAYHVGREAMSTYGEKYNGVQVGVLHHRHHFGVLKKPIDPYVVPGDKASGVLPRINPESPGKFGEADNKVQAYCYRMCLTTDDRNRVPFEKPAGYDPRQYEVLGRVLDAGWRETFEKFDPIPNHKTDTNNHGPFSTDNIGYNYDYPDASYERRREILREHEQYQRGLLYFLASDPRAPADVRAAMSKWGLAKDEFKDNNNWPHQIYVREARRLIGRYVMTENELLKRRPTPESIGMGSYTMDSHNIQRYITPEGYVQNEGDIGVGTNGPYEIAFGSIQPKREECQNLLVPVCLSSSHIAFGSIRMEPVFMILGQSAATTAVMAIEKNAAVQEVAYDALRERLLKDGQVLEFKSEVRPAGGGVAAEKLAGIVVDDSQATLTGNWSEGRTLGKWVGDGYQHDGAASDGKSSARFATKLPQAGRYEVRLSYSAGNNRTSRLAVQIEHAGGTAQMQINQKQQPTIEGLFVPLGEFEFSTQGAVVITNRDTDGHVIIDAVQWIAK